MSAAGASGAAAPSGVRAAAAAGSASASGEETKKAGARNKPFPKIDLHTHILPEKMPDWRKRFGYGDWIRLEECTSCTAKMYKGDEFFREIEDNCYKAEPRLRDCDATGVTVQVLSTVPVMFNYNKKPEDTLDMARFLNDDIAAVVKKNPRRFVGLGTLPMQAPELAVKELRRCVTELGLAGVEIGTNVNDWKLSEAKLEPIWKEAERLGACIFVHPWNMKGIEDGDKYWLPWLVDMPRETTHAICSLMFSGVFERYPNLKFAFAHGGGSFPGTIGRIQHGHDVRPDLCAVDSKKAPRSFLGKFYIDSLVHDADALRLVIKLIGPERIILGSDYPFPLGEHHPGKLIQSEAAGLDDETQMRLLWKNGLEFVGRKEEDFLPAKKDAAKEDAAKKAKAKK